MAEDKYRFGVGPGAIEAANHFKSDSSHDHCIHPVHKTGKAKIILFRIRNAVQPIQPSLFVGNVPIQTGCNIYDICHYQKLVSIAELVDITVTTFSIIISTKICSNQDLFWINDIPPEELITGKD